MTIDDPEPEGHRFRLPTWIPGSYLVREFARHFVHVRATADGSPIAIEKIDKNTWRTAPASGAVTVTAQVYAFDLSVRAAYLDDTRGYFNGPSVFLLPEGRDDAPCIVDVAPPQGDPQASWRVATTLARDGAPERGFGTYRAADYDELIDHPVEISEFTWTTFDVRGVTHEIAITGRHDADVSRLARDLARICD